MFRQQQNKNHVFLFSPLHIIDTFSFFFLNIYLEIYPSAYRAAHGPASHRSNTRRVPYLIARKNVISRGRRTQHLLFFFFSLSLSLSLSPYFVSRLVIVTTKHITRTSFVGVGRKPRLRRGSTNTKSRNRLKSPDISALCFECHQRQSKSQTRRDFLAFLNLSRFSGRDSKVRRLFVSLLFCFKRRGTA